MWNTISTSGLMSIRDDIRNDDPWQCLHQLLNVLTQLCTFRQAETMFARGIDCCELTEVVRDAFPSKTATGSFLRVFQQFSGISSRQKRLVRGCCARILQVIDVEQPQIAHDMWIQLFIARTLFELGRREFWLHALHHAESALLLAGGTLKIDSKPLDATEGKVICKGSHPPQHQSALPHARETWSTCLVCRAVGRCAHTADDCITHGKSEEQVRSDARLLILLLQTKNPGILSRQCYLVVVASSAMASYSEAPPGDMSAYITLSILTCINAVTAWNLYRNGALAVEIRSQGDSGSASKLPVSASKARMATVAAVTSYFRSCQLFFAEVRVLYPTAPPSKWHREADVVLTRLLQEEPSLFAQLPEEDDFVNRPLRAFSRGLLMNGSKLFAVCAAHSCQKEPTLRCRKCASAFCSRECFRSDHGTNRSVCVSNVYLYREARHFYRTYGVALAPPRT